MENHNDIDKKFYSSLSFRAPKTIVLVGIMGAGKTSIGKRLAKRLEIDFFDSDHEVERAAGCPVKEIFEIYGEEAFRKGEHRVIKRLLTQPIHVLATGGGSFMNAENRDLIKASAISVWLKANLDTLEARVARRNDRPLLDNGNQREILELLIEERYPIYSEADVIIDTFDEATNSTVDRVIAGIAEFIRKNHQDNYVLKAF